MKECISCGDKIEDSVSVCPLCGAKQPITAQSVIRSASPDKVAALKAVDSHKKTKIIAAVVAAVLVVLGIVIAATAKKTPKEPASSAAQGTTIDNSVPPTANGAAVDTPSDNDASQIVSAPQTGEVTDPQKTNPNNTATQGTPQQNTPPQNQPSPTAGGTPAGEQPAPQPVATTAPAIDTFTYFVNTVNSGNYAVTGTMHSAGEVMPMGMMFCGDNCRMNVNMEGIHMDMASVDGEIYLLNPEKKTYMILTEKFAEMMDITKEDLAFGELKWNLAAPSTAKKEKAELDGKTVDLYTIDAGTGVMKVYISGNDIKRFDKLDENGKPVAQYYISSFRGNITKKDLLPGEDYSSQNYLAFFAAMMKNMTQ